ncbi:MAG: nickel-responsive transcriptional regulator NikR [Armatimonadota bacterium]
MSELQRFGISMSRDLLQQFDEAIHTQGYANRSEAIRDIVRNYLIERHTKQSDAEVVGTVTLIYDHHTRGLESRLIDIQHEDVDAIRCSTHVHLDDDNCIEVLVVRGRAQNVREIADSLISTRGVKHGHLTCTSVEAIGKSTHSHDHPHDHDH